MSQKIKTFKGKDGTVLFPRTHARAVLMDDGSNIKSKIGNLSFKAVTESEYNALSTKDSNTVYFVK